MQRILILTACVCGCSFAGLRLADRLKSRLEALQDFKVGIHFMMNATENTNRPLAQIAAEFAARAKTEFWTDLSERLEAGENAESAWKAAFERNVRSGGPLHTLTQHDRALLDAFSATLGKTDRRSQSASGRVTLEELSTLIEDARSLYIQKARVYRVLGLMMGLGLGILMW